eukprot:TRINITY_DN3350_c0_g1_i1.p1 TRINITY_DN3350_c0_g1~~TRINITY_DN3350_c0_g1_i1.p1  ORF type:complete len:145 (-),score=28.83 TRINITY_DN3350_c0_g1_i1:35-469(-)
MLRRSFSFFNKKISTKYGEKCCRYNQNGQPMPKEKVKAIMETVKPFMQGWKLNEEHTQLIRLFYTRNYLMAVQFIKDVAKIDALSTRNCPSFHLTKGELLRLEVYSPPINGLSQVDFDLAMRINQMNFEAVSYTHLTLPTIYSV